MLDTSMQDALNAQINEELFSAYLYASMAAYFEDKNLSGCAQWMTAQAQEEMLHAQKIYRYINERGGRVRFAAIQEPEAEWDSPLDAFKAAYTHEQHITGCFNTLMDKAIDASDHATKSFLDWFIAEQVEEEDAADEIVQQLTMVKDAPNGIFMIDRELKQRQTPLTVAAAEDDSDE